MRFDNSHNKIYHQIPFKIEALWEISVSLSNSHLTAKGTSRDRDLSTTVFKKKKVREGDKEEEINENGFSRTKFNRVAQSANFTSLCYHMNNI